MDKNPGVLPFVKKKKKCFSLEKWDTFKSVRGIWNGHSVPGHETSRSSPWRAGNWSGLPFIFPARSSRREYLAGSAVKTICRCLRVRPRQTASSGAAAAKAARNAARKIDGAHWLHLNFKLASGWINYKCRWPKPPKGLDAFCCRLDE